MAGECHLCSWGGLPASEETGTHSHNQESRTLPIIPKSEEMHSSPEPPGRRTPALIVTFSPVRTMWDFPPTGLRENTGRVLGPQVGGKRHSSNRKLIHACKLSPMTVFAWNLLSLILPHLTPFSQISTPKVPLSFHFLLKIPLLVGGNPSCV